MSIRLLMLVRTGLLLAPLPTVAQGVLEASGLVENIVCLPVKFFDESAVGRVSAIRKRQRSTCIFKKINKKWGEGGGGGRERKGRVIE